FAADFLQIPSHDGHPCLKLTVPTTKPVMDLHHQADVHVGHTKGDGQFIRPLLHFKNTDTG
ncbi:MAG: hypothetical protein FWG98_03670, partial [Candidatus Cloacimonetes bacterium]|nr:hypothetical protein [Candidatus Cloacimonadota bacterium]